MANEMKKLVINPGCIGCGLCESIAPEVFSVKDVSRVKDDCDIQAQTDNIEAAVRACPMGVITWRT